MIWQINDIIKSCEFIYWDRWEDTKKYYKKQLEEYTKKHNKTNLLSSAIEIIEWKEPKEQIVWIASAF